MAEEERKYFYGIGGIFFFVFYGVTVKNLLRECCTEYDLSITVSVSVSVSQISISFGKVIGTEPNQSSL